MKYFKKGFSISKKPTCRKMKYFFILSRSRWEAEELELNPVAIHQVSICEVACVKFAALFITISLIVSTHNLIFYFTFCPKKKENHKMT